ncbi:hypothetical protein ETH_00008920 [Eimeria tenella]|uniref:Uncharacterized protein n=1 Tax=Eimeria tenella TaxID=5802 RepID=U6L674_EIMTE|nr:hypothetical protein ETH_00008920 [Eimeria tenella]CDJ43300.1 hypothetical protein ETH_00008920 [Eimeria tenella]|eukprot:XP_013234050.1 hypothetical protein ETH_00008920 [Eimeria tenella]
MALNAPRLQLNRWAARLTAITHQSPRDCRQRKRAKIFVFFGTPYGLKRSHLLKGSCIIGKKDVGFPFRARRGACSRAAAPPTAWH